MTFLQQHLSGSWHVFYEPIVEDVKPDFVLFSPYYGILILEVKDYTVHTIHHLAIDHWKIKVEEGIKNITSPLKQVGEYAYKLIGLLERQDVFLQDTGAYQGRLKFPIIYACWFVNLSNDDVHHLNITKVIPEKWIFTKDTLDLKETFEQRAKQIMKSKFSFSELPHDLSVAIKAMLYPEFRIPSHEQRRINWFNEFKHNVKIFPSIVDEVLFIATEIRHLHARGNLFKHLYVYFDENRYLKNKYVVDEIKGIFADMGIACAYENDEGVQVLPFEEFETMSNASAIFVLDIKLSSISEKKEVSLGFLRKDTSRPVYFTGSIIR